ncbi:MAG: oxidoreductase [Actinobacteria bacterium HGW-Actinobacteria-11]|nr:MAG: oxidoreductase [Actinobacteria bacterium HGW-Actinobacteria-11]
MTNPTRATREDTFRAAAAGLSASFVAVGLAELVAAVVEPSASPFAVIGSGLIDLAPSWAKDTAIALFGTGDKAALIVGIAVVLVVVAAVAGILERRRSGVGAVVLGALGALAVVAAMVRPGAGPFAWLPGLVAGLVAVVVLRLLIARLRPVAGLGPDDEDRRRFLLWTAGVAAAGAVALIVPRVDPADWSLRIHGMVEREMEITWDELLAMPMQESDVTLACVSNEVGGSLIGNARWLGLPVRDLLARAGVDADADMVLSTSADGFTASTPIEALTDDRDALLAIGMNGEPLPIEHGFPVRMVVPGLYGYVSATKWVTQLEVTRFDRATAYWTTRGWSERGPIKLQSRIDVPRRGQQVTAGDAVIAGMAWQQHVGIAGVEVRIDDGPWRAAELATAISTDTWVQWSLDWVAESGTHTIECRALNVDGETQTSDPAAPAPDGAQGWHRIDVSVA